MIDLDQKDRITFLRLIFSTLLVLIFILFQLACPDPPETTDCGAHQVKVNGDCECAEGYHWNEDQTKCLMDTTSHNFVWEIDTLGEYGSYLRDVAIIDENNIWVVGMIKIPDPDSSFNGTGWESFNAAHWDGNEWELYRLPALTYSGSISRGGLTSIHAISGENIWCSSDAGSYVYWNGQEWQSEWIPNRNGGINAIWGTSSSNLYFVGGNGSIVHYNGSTFTRMESGTDIDLLDVHGTGEYVYAVGHVVTGSNGGHSVLLKKGEDNWDILRYEENIYPTVGTDEFGTITAVWTVGDSAYVMTYAGLVAYHVETELYSVKVNRLDMGDSHLHITGISGNGLNDVMYVSRWAMVSHYNGVEYKLLNDIYDQYPHGAISSNGMDFKGNIIVSVGVYLSRINALIIKGVRN